MALTRDEFFDDSFDFDVGGLPGDITDSVNQLVPVNPLTPEELAEFSTLQQRAQRLSPIDIPELQNNRIAGNPYSINTAPLLNAISQGLGKVVNAARQRRLLSPQGEDKYVAKGAKELREFAKTIPDAAKRKMYLEQADAIDNAAQATSVSARLKALANKAATAKEQQATRLALIQELYPDLVNKAVSARFDIEKENVKLENKRRELEDKYGFDIGLENIETANELITLDKKLENELEVIDKKNGGDVGAISGQDINNLRQVMVPMLQRLDMEMNNIKGDYTTYKTEAARQAAVAPIKKKYDDLLNSVFRKAALSAGYSPDEVDNLITLTDTTVKAGVPAPGVDGIPSDSSAVFNWFKNPLQD